MTKGEAVDIVYLNLNGGKASTDNNVKRDEIGVYLAAAMGTALKSHIFELKSSGRSDKSDSVLYETSLPEGLYSTIFGTPEYNEDRAAYSMSLGKVFSLPYGWGVRSPRAKKNPSAVFIRLANPAISSAYESVFMGLHAYWTEEIGEETILFLKNLPTPICPMAVSVILDPSSVEDEATLNAPKDVIDGAIRLATEYFSAQFPASRRHDDKGTKEREA